MRRLLSIILVVQLVISCKIEEKFLPKTFSESKISRNISKIEIENLLLDSTLNIRALELSNDKRFGCFATSNGKVGSFSTLSDKVNFMHELEYDTINPNFRSLAITSKATFVLGISSPALLYKIERETNQLVYMENHPKAFYDSMVFWNDQEGIAIGDPTEDCMSVIITRDGGDTWYKLPCDRLPKAQVGEAAFAASDTNITIVGDHTWIATGGKFSRVMYSQDKGKSWQVFDTPIIQGKATTGMYSIDFYDSLHGFAIGGDYTNPDASSANKIRTNTGGKTWEVVSDASGPAYRSCVQYIPHGQAKELVAVGFKGVDYSNNAGDTWKHLSDEGFYTIRFLNDSVAYAAGNGRISKLIFRE